MLGRTAFVLSCTLASHALAGDILLDSPIACTLGEDQRCYVQHYVDRDDSAARRDFKCRTLTYDGHGGTDFAVRSWSEIARGVAVLAAAQGTVRAVRDGVPDIEYDPTRDANRLDGRDCGNGVVIRHNDGWETQYCHLREGSISVRPEDNVVAGDALGFVGMSGRASFPHLHLHVRHDGKVIDPYAPMTSETCAPSEKTLWRITPEYQPGGLISVGFSAGVPDYQSIKAGNAHSARLPADAPALVIWGFVFGTEPGDTLRLTITGPTGADVFTTDAKLESAQAQAFRAGGRRTTGATWFEPGRFAGLVEILRDGTVISDMQTEVIVTSP